MSYKEKSILAIIPARGGSKGVPAKNIRPLAGKPLIAYTIEAATKSKYVDRVIVSTDSETIADTCNIYGISIPFIRPSELSTDESPTWQTVEHAVDWLSNNEKKTYDVICLLQPTSPLRNVGHIDQSISKFLSCNADSLVSVCRSPKSPYWSQHITPDGYLSPLFPDSGNYIRRQDVPVTFDLNGAIYLVKTEFFRRTHLFKGPRTVAYEMDYQSSIDIDTPLDFEIAEIIRKQLGSHE